MRKFVMKAAFLSSIVVAGVAMATPASALSLHRLQNAYTGNGTFYLGIPGGPQNGHVPDDQALVVWQFGQEDQDWWSPDGQGAFWDFYTDSFGQSVCIAATGVGNGNVIIDQPCDGNNPTENEFWQLIPSYEVGLGSQYPGCNIILNPYSGKVIGVSGGNANVSNGGAVVQWDYDGTANQFWCEVAR